MLTANNIFGATIRSRFWINFEGLLKYDVKKISKSIKGNACFLWKSTGSGKCLVFHGLAFGKQKIFGEDDISEVLF